MQAWRPSRSLGWVAVPSSKSKGSKSLSLGPRSTAVGELSEDQEPLGQETYLRLNPAFAKTMGAYSYCIDQLRFEEMGNLSILKYFDG